MPTGFGGVMSGAAIVFFAFIGFDAVSTTAEETKNPQRDMPIGMIASLIICTILYVLMSVVLTGMKKYTVYLGDSAAVATAFAGKPWAQALISAGALAGMTSVLLVFQLGQPRIFMAMARDGLLPQYFARIHPRFRTPYITTIWTGIVVGGVAMFTDIGSLADLTNIGTLFAFALVCIGVIVLRRTDPNRPRPFRVPFVPIFPLLGVFFCWRLMLSLPIETWIRFFVWLAIGLAIYFFYSVRHSRLRHGIDTGETEEGYLRQPNRALERTHLACWSRWVESPAVASHPLRHRDALSFLRHESGNTHQRGYGWPIEWNQVGELADFRNALRAKKIKTVTANKAPIPMASPAVICNSSHDHDR